MDTRDGTYHLDVYCINCGWEGIMDLPKGVPFKSHSSHCEACGCMELKKRINPLAPYRVRHTGSLVGQTVF